MNTIDSHFAELEPILRDVVVVYIINKEGNKVLLGERKKPNRPGQGKRVGIGGGIEQDESAEEALLREVIEEIGTGQNGETLFELKSAKQVGTVYFLFPHKKDEPGYNQRCIVFVSDDYEGNPVESNEIKPEWYPVDKLPEEFMWPDNLLWVPKVLQGENINATFLYDANNIIAESKFEQ